MFGNSLLRKYWDVLLILANNNEKARASKLATAKQENLMHC